MAVIEHVVAKTLEVAGEAATGEGAIEAQEAGGDGIPDEAVQPCDGCVSVVWLEQVALI